MRDLYRENHGTVYYSHHRLFLGRSPLDVAAKPGFRVDQRELDSKIMDKAGW
jgi:hypothetical protein